MAEKDWDDATMTTGDTLTAAQWVQMASETHTTSGDATIPADTLSVTVTHGFGATPKHVYLEVISSTIVLVNAPVADRNSTTFKIYLDIEQDSEVTVRWKCEMEA